MPKNDKSSKTNPMMYIVQPKLAPANASMQSTYRKRKSIVQDNSSNVQNKLGEKGENSRENSPQGESKQPNDQKIKKVPISKSRNEQIANDEGNTESDIVNDEKSKSSHENNSEPNSSHQENKERKRFKDMNTKERLEYLSHTPPGVPKMKCEIKTADEVYRGLVATFDGIKADLRIIKRPYKATVSIDEIEEINLLGL